MVVKTTRITIETESLLVVRRGKTIVTWCPACCAEAEAMTLEGTSLGDIPSTLFKRLAGCRQAPPLESQWRSFSDLPYLAASVLRIRGRSQTSRPETNGLENRRRKMKSIQFVPKWPRLARLSLALATLAAPVCTLAQPTNSPRYMIVDL